MDLATIDLATIDLANIDQDEKLTKLVFKIFIDNCFLNENGKINPFFNMPASCKGPTNHKLSKMIISSKAVYQEFQKLFNDTISSDSLKEASKTLSYYDTTAFNNLSDRVYELTSEKIPNYCIRNSLYNNFVRHDCTVLKDLKNLSIPPLTKRFIGPCDSLKKALDRNDTFSVNHVIYRTQNILHKAIKHNIITEPYDLIEEIKESSEFELFNSVLSYRYKKCLLREGMVDKVDEACTLLQSRLNESSISEHKITKSSNGASSAAPLIDTNSTSTSVSSYSEFVSIEPQALIDDESGETSPLSTIAFCFIGLVFFIGTALYCAPKIKNLFHRTNNDDHNLDSSEDTELGLISETVIDTQH